MATEPRRRRRPSSASLVVLAGGVGAARFLAGLVRVVDPARVTVIVNTGDDVVRHGLHVSPDIDSVVYGLAGLSDEERGWGVRNETWRCLERLGALGEPTWFQLGDQDLATHIWRTSRQRAGDSLTRITAAQCAALGVPVRLLPMTDDRVTTRIRTPDGEDLHVQEWFVRDRCLPTVTSVRFAGIEHARPSAAVVEAIDQADALIICPSNPIISIGPILAMAGLREALRSVPTGIAVTPIVAGRAVKGPAAELLAAQGTAVTPAGVASLYADLVQAMVIDECDRGTVADVEALSLRAVVVDTLMTDVSAATRLAQATLDALGLDGPAVAA